MPHSPPCPLSRPLAVLFSLAFATAQTLPPPAEAAATDPMALLAAAEHDLVADRREAALLRLWAARRLLPGLDGAVRDAADTASTALLAKADPLLAERAAADAATARPLLLLSRAYRGRKWIATADELVAAAAEFDPAAAQKEAQASIRPPAAKPAGEPFAALGQLAVEGSWQARDGALFTPDPLAPTSAWYVTRTPHADHAIAVDIDVGDRSAMFGILLGATGHEQYHIVDYEFWKGTTTVQVRFWRWRDGDLRELAVGHIELDRLRTAPTRLQVLVRGNRVEARADGKVVLDAAADAPLRGNVGFYASGSSKLKTALAVRNFELAPLPEDTPTAAAIAAAADADRQRTVTEVIAAAERLLAKKQPELAAAKLRAARGSALAIAAATVRSTLLAAVDKLLATADPLQARRQKAFAEAAAAQAALAEAYAAAGMPRAAAFFAAVIERLDAEGQAATAAALRAAAPK